MKLLRVARFMSKVLYTRHDNEVVKITLNNPSRNNAFDDEIISSLISILEDIEHSNNIKLVVLGFQWKAFFCWCGFKLDEKNVQVQPRRKPKRCIHANHNASKAQ